MGFLALLWIFIYAILRLMRQDLNRVDSKYSSKSAVSPNDLSKTRSGAKVNKVVVITEDFEKEYELRDGMSFGRSNEASVQIEDDYASSKHAQMRNDNGSWIYEDLGSTNGSWQDRKRISGPIRIKRGTTIKIGNTELRFEK
jgi:pSer/pThr/pTyr-binding forkhead associated (FHA) protein